MDNLGIRTGDQVLRSDGTVNFIVQSSTTWRQWGFFTKRGKGKGMRFWGVLFAGLGLMFAASCSKKGSGAGLSAAEIDWADVAVVRVPSAPGIETDKLWQFQAVVDRTCLHMRLTYPDKLPPLSIRQNAGFKPMPEGFNMLPSVYVVTPPHMLAPGRMKTKLPDGGEMDFQQVGDPKSVVCVHPQLLVNYRGPGRGYDWSRIVLGASVREMEGDTKTRQLTYGEHSPQANRFVIEERSFIVSVPLAERGSDVWAGGQVEPVLEAPLPAMSLRVQPAGTNQFVYYLPEILSR